MTGVSVLFQVVISDVHRAYFQGAGGSNHYPLFRAFYNLHLDVALCMGKANMNQNLPLQAFSSLNEDFVCPSF
jgi:hypothetical protein